MRGYEVDGDQLKSFPLDSQVLQRCKPIYEVLPGWNTSTFGITDYDALPDNAKAYLSRIEVLCDLPIRIISTGPERNHTIMVAKSM